MTSNFINHTHIPRSCHSSCHSHVTVTVHAKQFPSCPRVVRPRFHYAKFPICVNTIHMCTQRINICIWLSYLYYTRIRTGFVRVIQETSQRVIVVMVLCESLITSREIFSCLPVQIRLCLLFLNHSRECLFYFRYEYNAFENCMNVYQVFISLNSLIRTRTVC